ncbi:hypothetical protein RP20_CCG013483 [Aedes albopictus]|nr:hypothetical protein RP20_CCG013483 [Aedes albopictus]
MFSRQKCFKTGVYRTNGLVNNWKFRITLKKIYSLIEIPQFDQSNEANLFDEPSGNAEEQLEIIWQGKVFSQYEIEYYGVRENCSTDLQKSYHNTIKSSGLADRENRGKIFTYTTADNYAPDDELSMAIQISRTRVEQEDDFESMFIMADLASEVVLFTIRWNSKENMLLVYPDFNSMAVNPYYKEIQGDSRQMYHFGIQNLSSALKRSVSRETVQIQDALMAKLTRLTLREELSKDNFSYPENHQLQFLVLLEVISGENFSYDNTHNDSTVLNRYGSRTEMAGTLDIKCQIIQQHRPQIVQLTGMGTKKHSKFRANVVTIEELLNSYQRARERLEEVVNLKY